MQLNEIVESLTTPLIYTQIANTPQLLRYGFVFEEVTFFVDFDINHIMTNTIPIVIATVTFYEVSNTGVPAHEQTNKYENPLILFSTVKSIIDNNISNWDYVIFTAMEEGSRVGLYTRLVKKHTSKFHVYMVHTALGTLYIIGKSVLDEDTKQLIATSAESIIRQKI